MTLGEKIVTLRAEHHMSQGDLAEAMGVSRQSISKWETSGSTPDLDKLIVLSDLFQVSLDALVKDDLLQNEPAKAEKIEDSAEKPAPPKLTTQRIIGFILLGVALLCAVFALVTGPELLFPAAYLLVCGILLLVIPKYAGLIIGWLTFLPIFFFSPWFTSTSMGAIFVPYLYQNGMYIQLIVSFVMWALMTLLVFATLRRTPLRGKTPLVMGWAAFYYLRGYLLIALGGRPYNGIIYLALAWLTVVLLAALVFFTALFVARWVQKRRGKATGNRDATL